MHFSAGGHHVGRESLVIFHVAGRFVLHPALKFSEQLRGVLTEDINQHVEAPAVRHTDDNLLRLVATTALHHLRQHRNQALAPFQAEAFGSRILGAQRFLQPLSLYQAFQ